MIEVINDFYFNETGLKQLIPGQMRYHCIKADEPAGKPLNQCEMKTVVLSLFDDLDDTELPFKERDASISRRWRKMMRITEEAREQGGLLTQEDLAHLLMCDIRTIRRDIAALKRDGIVVPTRGTINDIGPGVTHKAIAIRLWIEGKEPTEVAKAIHHSLKAVENYLQKFMRVVYLRRKNFTDLELLEFYRILTLEQPLPVYIYNMPAMTKIEMSPDLILKIAELPGIAGYKDSAGSFDRFCQAANVLKERKDFSLFMGPDALLGKALQVGACGGVNSGANLAPQFFVGMYKACLSGNTELIQHYQSGIVALQKIYQFRENICCGVAAGLKNGLNKLGIMDKYLCRPAVPMEEQTAINDFVAVLAQEVISKVLKNQERKGFVLKDGPVV